MGVLDAVHLILALSLLTAAAVIAMALLFARYVRSARANHRAVVRELGRMRVKERDTGELHGVLIREVRRSLEVTRWQGYADAVVDIRKSPAGGATGGTVLPFRSPSDPVA